MKRRTRILSAFLATAVLSLVCLPAEAMAASQSTKATTLRLEATEGTVGLKNASGKKLAIKESTKLYSGYTVATNAKSYAWISLDDDVVVKLDASSKATVKQNRKKLEVMLESGKLFFNVSKPIPSDGSLNIRTTSMTTGVRGTSGLVSVSNDIQSTTNSSGQTVSTYVSSSQLVVYEGTVTLTYSSAPVNQPAEGGSGTPEAQQPAANAVTTSVTAGFQADVVKTTSVPTNSSAPASTQVKSEVQPVSVKESLANTGFAAVELASNKALCEKIAQGTNDVDLSALQQIASQSKDVLKKEQAAAEQQVQAQEAAVKEVLNTVEQKVTEQKAAEQTNPAAPPAIDPVFPPSTTPPTTPPSTGGGGGGGGGGSSSEPIQYTVTFKSGDLIFGTQTVKNGSLATAPRMQPTEHGAWTLNGKAFDFKTPVKSNLTLSWTASATPSK